MGTGGKIAIGCGIAALVVVIILVVTVGAGFFWAKGKVESMAAEQKQIEDLRTQANKNEFSAPDDGVVQEPQLVRFLEVRKKVYDVYSRNEDAIKKMKEKEKADLSDMRKGIAVLNELRLAQAKAQVDQHMGDSEYQFLVQQIYKSSWAAQVSDETKSAAGEAAPSLDVPKANVALFKKYEADIKKYAMNGMEWVNF